ncbi:hypothetical protein [Phormidium sp. CCY1219]|uniref:hypothetical protein n=1 Tax=Phormidium sp. CCY1219 TaxID=2886104 RepID=UPI002D1EE6BE|nr:hypothetical protein [Phormidium sp. CCY1219]MEB3831902.1 hypothetical protein [Phormidium sp. CCY1219]
MAKISPRKRDRSCGGGWREGGVIQWGIRAPALAHFTRSAGEPLTHGKLRSSKHL